MIMGQQICGVDYNSRYAAGAVNAEFPHIGNKERILSDVMSAFHIPYQNAERTYDYNANEICNLYRR